MYIVLEFIKGGDLHKKLDSLPDKRLEGTVGDVSDGLGVGSFRDCVGRCANGTLHDSCRGRGEESSVAGACDAAATPQKRHYTQRPEGECRWRTYRGRVCVYMYMGLVWPLYPGCS